MKIINASYEILTPKEHFKLALPMIERAARTCYKSEDKICEGSAEILIDKLLNFPTPHMSVMEHFSFTVKFVCDRGVLAELTRHRLASFSVESTRYCNYSKGKFGGEITVIKPCFWEEGSAPYNEWETACLAAEDAYVRLLGMGCKPQEARDVLPTSLKTEIIMTCNLREFNHILGLRCSPRAHPQMKELMIPLLKELRGLVPVVFDKNFDAYCVY